MAARRVVYPVDTSDWVANIVLGTLFIAVLALFGLIAVLGLERGSGDPQPVAQEAATEVPAAAATVTPAPTAAPDVDEDDAAPVVPPPADADRATPGTDGAESTTTESVTPLQPRELRTDPSQATEPAPPPAAGAPDPEDQAPDQPEPPAPPDEPEPAPPDEPEPAPPDEPVGASSPLDDPDRIPALVISDEPIDVRTAVADLDGDGVSERVWAAIVRNQVHVRVDRYEPPGGWTEAAAMVGPAADDLVDLRTDDLTGDGDPEIHTKQWVGTNGESVALWSFGNGRLRPMTASGGCFDGGNTFGAVGALVEPRQVLAICEEDPLPAYLWSTSVYRWVDGMWTFQGRVGV